MSETLVSLWTQLRRRFEAAGVDTPVLDARLLLEAGAGVSRLDIVTDPRRVLSDEQIAGVEALAQRREAREPIAHILGKKAFWSFDLVVTDEVLTPRPETELLVEAALATTPKDAPVRVLDLGVGSGAIVLAVLTERPLATGVGVDISPAALEVARANAEALGLADRLELRHGDWAAGLDGQFDLVLANPPYIPAAEIAALEPEVERYDPLLALDGGSDGLEAYRSILRQLSQVLAPGGVFAFELGQGQAEAVQALAADHGFLTETPMRDLAGVPRVVRGRGA